MVHLGHEVQKIVEKRGVKISWLADQIGRSRAFVYNRLFTAEHLSTRDIDNLNAVLDVDLYALKISGKSIDDFDRFDRDQKRLEECEKERERLNTRIRDLEHIINLYKNSQN